MAPTVKCSTLCRICPTRYPVGAIPLLVGTKKPTVFCASLVTLGGAMAGFFYRRPPVVLLWHLM